jgi:hypothetical protein
MRRNDAESQPDKRQTSTQPPPASREVRSANTSEQAAKSKPDKGQRSTQPAAASTKAKSANTSEQAVAEAFFDARQSLQRQEISDKELAEVLSRNLLIRINYLFAGIEEVFSGQPVNQGWGPDAKANQVRVKAYVTYCTLASKLLGLAIELSKAISSMPNPKQTGTDAENDLKT